MSRVFLVVEIILISSALIIGGLWVYNPNESYEPILVLIGFLLTATEVFRRKSKKLPLNVESIIELEKIDTVIELKKTDNGVSGDLTVEKITSEINNAPPFQAESIAANFKDIKVKWNGYFYGIREDDHNKNKVHVQCRVNIGDLHSFYFSVILSEHPELKVLRKDSKIEVLGVIQKASGDGLNVTLNPISIKISS